jgi:hypothetical protein
MTTRNLFERPELLDNQTRLILSATAKPKRLTRSAARSAGLSLIRERLDSATTTSVTQEIDDDALLDENTDEDSSPRKTSTVLDGIDYDTDIEQEEEPNRDYTCKGVYIDQCHRHGVIPSTYILRHIDTDSLAVRYSGLKSINMKVMIPSLKINSSIVKLDLRDNGIGSRGAIYIAHLIEENEYIEELHLGNNDIGTQGMNMIFTKNKSRLIYF